MPYWALGERERRGCAPQGLVRIGLGGGAAPLLPSLLFSLCFSPTPTTWKGGILLPMGVGLPLARPPPGRPPPPPLLLYIRRKGHPLETQQLIINLLAVCGAPSTIIHLGHIVAVLRRSPASVASSTPSPRRRADEALLDREFAGRH